MFYWAFLGVSAAWTIASFVAMWAMSFDGDVALEAGLRRGDIGARISGLFLLPGLALGTLFVVLFLRRYRREALSELWSFLRTLCRGRGAPRS